MGYFTKWSCHNPPPWHRDNYLWRRFNKLWPILTPLYHSSTNAIVPTYQHLISLLNHQHPSTNQDIVASELGPFGLLGRRGSISWAGRKRVWGTHNLYHSISQSLQASYLSSPWGKRKWKDDRGRHWNSGIKESRRIRTEEREQDFRSCY